MPRGLAPRIIYLSSRFLINLYSLKNLYENPANIKSVDMIYAKEVT